LKDKFGRPIGFARLLPVYVTILKVCKDLAKLTLHQKPGDTLLDNDLDQRSGKADQQKIDDAISKVFEGLKGFAAR
jgi:hypothetical protein